MKKEKFNDFTKRISGFAKKFSGELELSSSIVGRYRSPVMSVKASFSNLNFLQKLIIRAFFLKRTEELSRSKVTDEIDRGFVDKASCVFEEVIKRDFQGKFKAQIIIVTYSSGIPERLMGKDTESIRIPAENKISTQI